MENSFKIHVEIGHHKDLSNEEYHADPAISRSGLMMFKESPYKYWANYLNPKRPKKKTTDAMEFGTAFHMFMLEPHLFAENYTMEPERVFLKDVGREAYDEYKKIMKQIGEKKFISSPDMTTLFEMRKSLERNKEAWDLINGAKYEQSYFWDDVESGLIVKARPDILHPNMIVDVKTCVSASPRAYQRVMADGGYHIQGAMIREGVRVLTGVDIPNVINICVEKTYPYCVGIKIISEAALDAGRLQFKQILMDMKHAIVHNDYPSYPIETVDLPGWYA